MATVQDGAEWIQGLREYHCPTAARILDLPHAAQRICQIGEAVLGAEHASLRAWQTRQIHDLKHRGPELVLARLRHVAAEHLSVPVVAENLAYLEKRVAHRMLEVAGEYTNLSRLRRHFGVWWCI